MVSSSMVTGKVSTETAVRDAEIISRSRALSMSIRDPHFGRLDISPLRSGRQP